MAAFIMTTLPSLLLEVLLPAGCLHSASVTLLHCYYTPIRHLLIFDPFPGKPVIESTLLQCLSHWDEEGFSSCFAYPLISCRHYHSAEVVRRISHFHLTLLLSPIRLRVQPSGLVFRSHLCVHFHYGLISRTYPIDKFVGRLQHLGFPPCCYPSYRKLTFVLVGLISH
jgi:hypothetical protein